MSIAGSVEKSKPLPSPNRRRMVPDGIQQHRKSVSKFGRVLALILMLAVTVVGLLWSWILTGPTGGIGGFLILALALPALPVLGAPATGSTSKYLLAFLISGGVWLILGLVATNRALQRPIVTWREWTLEFAPLGLALMLGVVLGIGITALTIL